MPLTSDQKIILAWGQRLDGSDAAKAYVVDAQRAVILGELAGMGLFQQVGGVWQITAAGRAA